MVARLRHKYGAIKTSYKGHVFPSKLEARCARWLDGLIAAGEVNFYLKQVPFHLLETRYVCDFEVFWTDGHVSFIDAKGISTSVFEIKKKQVEATYPVEIQIWNGKK